MLTTWYISKKELSTIENTKIDGYPYIGVSKMIRNLDYNLVIFTSPNCGILIHYFEENEDNLSLLTGEEVTINEYNFSEYS